MFVIRKLQGFKQPPRYLHQDSTTDGRPASLGYSWNIETGRKIDLHKEYDDEKHQ